MATTRMKESPSTDRYFELVTEFPLRPIRSTELHQRAKKMLRSLGDETDTAVRDYKTVLITLIAAYEKDAGQRLDTSKLDASAIVYHLLAERSMSVNALAKKTQVAQSALSDMLNGKRDWSKSAIIRVADFLGLD